MSEKLYFIGMTSIFELLISHDKDEPLYFSVGRPRNRLDSLHHT